jgi:hypothetical protein
MGQNPIDLIKSNNSRKTKEQLQFCESQQPIFLNYTPGSAYPPQSHMYSVKYTQRTVPTLRRKLNEFGNVDESSTETKHSCSYTIRRKETSSRI